MKKVLLSTFILCAAIFSANAQFVKNDFMTGTTVGANLEKGEYAGTTQGENFPIMANQWNRTGKEGSGNMGGVSPLVIAPLTYTGYAESGKSNGIQLARFEKEGSVSPSRFSIYSLTDGAEYNEGAYYVALMATVEEVASSGGADFFCLDGNYTANNQRAKLFVTNAPSSESTKFVFGLADDSSAPAVSTTTEYNKGETVLLVLKYDFSVKGETGNTGIKLFINPDLTAETEPAATLQTEAKTGSLSQIRGITVRQRTTTKVQLGGIRFSDNWKGAIGLDGSSIGNENADKGNLISTRYFDLKGVEVKEPVSSNIYIKKDIYDSGATEVSKIIK
jgi:hypothetical protein